MSTTGFSTSTPKKWVPKKYQLQGSKWLSSRPGAALFWAPGLGKTTTVYDAFLSIRKRKLGKRMLVVGPLKVVQGVWRQEAEKWEQFAGLKIGLAHGKGKEDVLLDESLDVVLLNYDGLLWAAPYLAETDLFDIVVWDELTRMKHTNTRRFKLIKPLLVKFNFRWGLTGTPAPNGLMDLFGQVFVLDGGQRLGQFITRFRYKYFHKKPFDQWTWYPNTGADKEMTRALSNLAHYVDETDWNDMPQLVTRDLRIVLPPDIMKGYKKLERDFILQLKKGVVTASNAAVLTSKLRQYASGSVYDEGRQVLHIHDEKIERLESLIEELAGDPLIVAVGFLHEVEAIRAALGRKVYGDKEMPYLGGGVSAARTNEIIQHWNLGWLPVMLVHPTSVAHGLNLQAGGRAMCWYTQTFNLEEYLQLIRRIYRQGQGRRVFNYRIVADRTMDDYLSMVLEDKDTNQKSLLTGLKEFYDA